MPYSAKNYGKHTRKILILTHIYFLEIIRSLSFKTLTLVGVCLFFILAQYNIRNYPLGQVISSKLVLEELSIYASIYPIILTIIFVGEMVWREKDFKFNSLLHSLPIQSWLILSTKFLGLAFAFAVYMCVGILAGLIFQSGLGYFDYDIGLYFKIVFCKHYLYLLVAMLLGFFIHQYVNNKYLGHAIFIFILFIGILLINKGIDTSIFKFSSELQGKYSENEGFLHFIYKFFG